MNSYNAQTTPGKKHIASNLNTASSIAGKSSTHLPDNRPSSIIQKKQTEALKNYQPMQMKGKVNVNDDAGLEKEADAMGARAISQNKSVIQQKNGVKENRQKQFSFSHGSIFQRQPVGTGAGTDNDRNNIQVQDMAPNEQVSIRGDNQGRARVFGNFIVNNVNHNNQVLKHYMVVKHGTLYQFPIKHVFQPRQNLHHQFIPNPYNLYGRQATAGNRGGQPDAFGGNTDLAHNVQQNNQNLTALRNNTLGHEYAEENLAHNNAALNVTRTKKFGSNFGVGTLSIAETNQQIAAGNNAHALNPRAQRGEAEMAGTVVIDCAQLIAGNLVDDALEQAIGNLLQNARNAFYQANAGHDVNNERQQGNIFASNAGILGHLIGMVKEDIIAQRQQRRLNQINALEQNLAQRRQQVIANLRQHDLAERQRRIRELAQQERMRRIAFYTTAGLIILLAWMLRNYIF